MEPVDALGLFGLTRQEAGLYLTLLSEGELSGYEAAKHAGLSRSNAYAGLASLVSQGAAYVADGAVPRYWAVEPQDFFRHRVRTLSEVADALVPVLPRRRSAPDGYLTISGAGPVLDRMKTMVEAARLRIYFSLALPLVTPLLTSLQEAAARGIKITALTDAALEVPGCIVHRTSTPTGQIRLIVDSTEVLTGDWEAAGGASCLYSKRPALVDLFKQALGNEIRLLELGEARRIE